MKGTNSDLAYSRKKITGKQWIWSEFSPLSVVLKILLIMSNSNGRCVSGQDNPEIWKVEKTASASLPRY